MRPEIKKPKSTNNITNRFGQCRGNTRTNKGTDSPHNMLN